MVWEIKYIDEFIEAYKTYYEYFLKHYRERVEEYYKPEYQIDPESFPLMQPIKVISLFKTGDIITYFVRSDTDNDEYSNATYFFKTDEEQAEFWRLPDHIQSKKLRDMANVENYLHFENNYYGESDDPRPNWDSDIPARTGAFAADKHFYNYEKKLKTVEYDLFDVRSVITKVNDEDFQYEFEESIKAYNSNLFLASAITSAVALETVLKLTFIKNFSVEELPQRYYITTLADKLKEAGIINERLYHRILSVNQLRRGVAHSKTGKIEQWDAEQTIGSVKIIVDSLF